MVHINAVGFAAKLPQLHGYGDLFGAGEGVILLAPASIQEAVVLPAVLLKGCDTLFLGEVSHGGFLWCY